MREPADVEQLQFNKMLAEEAVYACLKMLVLVQEEVSPLHSYTVTCTTVQPHAPLH